MTIVSPATFARWIREESAEKPKSSKPKGGQRKPTELRELVLHIAAETSVSLTRIVGELRKLGIKPHTRVCSQILEKSPPARQNAALALVLSAATNRGFWGGNLSLQIGKRAAMSAKFWVVFGTFALSLPGCVYTGEVKCEFCNKPTKTIKGDESCVPQDAIDSAHDKCSEQGGFSPGSGLAKVTDFAPECFFSSASTRNPLETARMMLAAGYHTVVRTEPQAAATEDPVECTPFKTFNVMARYEVPLPSQCSNSSRIIRVTYNRYVAPGESEEATIEAAVPLGQSYTFTIDDSAEGVSPEFVADFRVEFQKVEVNIFTNTCVFVPLEEAFGASASVGGSVVPDSGTYNVTWLANGQLETSVTNPADDAPARPKSEDEKPRDPALRPIPDPKFSAARR